VDFFFFHRSRSSLQRARKFGPVSAVTKVRRRLAVMQAMLAAGACVTKTAAASGFMTVNELDASVATGFSNNPVGF
jgi:hypothetical protein